VRAWIPTSLVAAAVLALAPVAQADSARSTNWAGYAIHRSGVSFQSIVAAWRQPKVACTPGKQSYSAYWVGLGGYNPFSQALEQDGTEADCTPGGKMVMSAWYELIPAPSTTVKLTVKAGDMIVASVSVAGQMVTFVIYDMTRKHGFSTTQRAAAIDVSSAEWIVEAPSTCITDNLCQTLPLADFGSATFISAQAQLDTGHSGSISDPAWDRTKIRLSPAGRRFIVYNGSGPVAGAATPSGLRAGGSSFKVTFSKVSIRASTLRSVSGVPLLSGRLYH
jgi:hypothetical protein